MGDLARGRAEPLALLPADAIPSFTNLKCSASSLSGGHIKIYSEEGQGTTIKIYLPIEGGDETVLVVEDELLVRNFVSVNLKTAKAVGVQISITCSHTPAR
jgi:hypothetical protein